MLKDQVLDLLEEIDPDILVPDGLEEAIVGYAERSCAPTVAVLDTDRCIDILMEDGIEKREEAIEYFEFNILGSYVGEHTPVFVTFFQKERGELRRIK